MSLFMGDLERVVPTAGQPKIKEVRAFVVRGRGASPPPARAEAPVAPSFDARRGRYKEERRPAASAGFRLSARVSETRRRRRTCDLRAR